jgi:hypothetical protein
MAANCIFNRESGEIGDNITINGHECTVQNSYKLVTNPETNESYYEVKIEGHDTKFLIDEASITRILLLKIGDTIYNTKLLKGNNDAIIFKISRNKGIYLGRYLLNYLEGDNKIHHINENKLDFRQHNIVLKTQKEINSLTKIVRKPYTPKPAPIFFKDESKEILQEERNEHNSYMLIRLKDTNEEYIEMHVKDAYYTIFSRESLDDVLKFRWYMSGDYAAAKVITSCNDPKILELYEKGDSIYLHRYLIQIQGIHIPEKLSIDHINHNNLDNRLTNLRIATQSEQNNNRPQVKRNVIIPEDINPGNLLEKVDMPLYISLGNSKDGHSPLFNIEIKYPGMDRIRTKSTSVKYLNLLEKLCDAIHKRYLLIIKNNLNIQLLTIDGLKFVDNEEFKIHSINLIKNFMIRNNTPQIIDFETLDTYILEKKRDKLKSAANPNTNIGTDLIDNLVSDVIQQPSEVETKSETIPISKIKTKARANPKFEEKKLAAAQQPMDQYKTPLYNDNIHLIFDRVKPQFIGYSTPEGRALTFDGDYTYQTNPRKKLNFGGISDITLTLNEKLAWTVLKRYSAFVVHENNTNDLIYKDGALPPTHGKNTNTTGFRTLSDLTFNECELFERDRPSLPHIFTSFRDFKIHTETFISNILNKSITMEEYVAYIKSKVARVSVPVLALKYQDTPVLTK